VKKDIHVPKAKQYHASAENFIFSSYETKYFSMTGLRHLPGVFLILSPTLLPTTIYWV